MNGRPRSPRRVLLGTFAGFLGVASVVVVADGPAASATRPSVVVEVTSVRRQAPDPSAATRDPSLLIVMDTSSSMTETDELGKPRIDGAKAAVTDFIDTLPRAARVGLSAYPADGDCTVSTPLIPIAQVDPAVMSAQVRTLDPEGNTPTGAALEQAGRDLLASGSGPYAIVLVSDGESNCESTSPPPCDVARDLAAQGIDVTINTVGFQIDAAGKTELQCIADAAGGTYVDAGSGEDLSDAITAYSVPDLTLDIEHPETVALQPGSDNSVAVEGTITNIGAITAPNVQATLTFDAEFSPGSARPRHRLGNLAVGESMTIEWTVRPTGDFVDQTVRFDARAFTRGFATEARPGEIRFRWQPVDEAVARFDAGSHLVVLGDSYSSGEGVSPHLRAEDAFEPGVAATGDRTLPLSASNVYTAASDRRGDTPNTCHQAPYHSYGAYVAAAYDMDYTLLACSGATTVDLWARSPEHYLPSREPQPSQLTQLEDLATPADVVMMTIGGNDIGFAEQVAICLVVNCGIDSDLTSSVPGVGSTSAVAARARFLQRLSSLDAKLTASYQRVVWTASEAADRPVPLIVLGYPRGAPPVGTPCGFVNDILFDAGDRQYLNQVADLLNAVIEGAVSDLARDGWPVSFVDGVASAFQPDHTVCARTEDQWINGVSRVKNSSFHPNRLGHQALARTVQSWLSERFLSSAIPSPPTAAYIPPDPNRTIEVRDRSTASLTTGSSIWVSADGFASGSLVEVSVASEPEVVNLVPADEGGRVRAAAHVRRDLPLGEHTLVLTGVDATDQPRELRRPIEVSRPRPQWWSVAVALEIVLVVVAAGCLVAMLRRPRTPRRDLSRAG